MNHQFEATHHNGHFRTNKRYKRLEGQIPRRSMFITTRRIKRPKPVHDNEGILASKEIQAKYINAGALKADNVFADEIYGDVVYSDVITVMDKKSSKFQKLKNLSEVKNNTNEFIVKQSNNKNFSSGKNGWQKRRLRINQNRRKHKRVFPERRRVKRRYKSTILDANNHPSIAFQNGYIKRKRLRPKPFDRLSV